MDSEKRSKYVLSTFAGHLANTVQLWMADPHPNKETILAPATENWVAAVTKVILKLDGEEKAAFFQKMSLEEKIQEFSDSDLSFEKFLAVARDVFESRTAKGRT